MAALFCDGFDKYGPAGQTTPTVPTLLIAGEWTTSTANQTIVAGLSAAGLAVGLGNAAAITKALSANYTRLLGGVRFSTNLGGTFYLQCTDGGTAQAAISIATTGVITFRNGNFAGTVLATAATPITANSTHYLEWDITFGNSAAYQVWLDGASIISGTGDTTGTANNYANQLVLGTAGGSGTAALDDLYLFDATGTTCNAPLLNNPIVETAFPNADTATKAWNNGASIIGLDNQAAGGVNSAGSVINTLYVRPFIAPANMTLNSVSMVGGNSNFAAANLRPVVYASVVAGAALLASGPTVVGITSATVLTMPLTTPLSLVGGTTYAIGFMSDTGLTLSTSDGASATFRCAATFASGAPGTLPAMTGANPSYWLWGNCTGSAQDYVSLNINPPVDDAAYIYETTVGDEELFGFPALSSNPASIACVAIKARLKRSDSGARTVDVRCASGAADTAGAASAITVGTTYAWLGNYQSTDPNTGIAWTGTAVNGVRGGTRIAG